MKLKSILENFIDPVSGAHMPTPHHHPVDTPAHPAAHKSFPDPLHHKTEDNFSAITHHVNVEQLIKDPSVYYIKPDDSSGAIDKRIPETKQADDKVFKLYDFNNDGVLDQKDLMTHLKHLSKKYDVPMSVIQSIIKHESGWDPNAIGKNKGSEDIGLMQLNNRYIDYFVKSFWKHDGVKFDAKNPFENAEVGVAYLHDIHKNLKDTPDWERTIMAYNVGTGRVKAGIEVPAGKKYLAAIIKIINSKKYGVPTGIA